MGNNLKHLYKICTGEITPEKSARKIRDLNIYELTDEFSLVFVCDSNAGFGFKTDDKNKRTADIVARCYLKVPLSEIYSCGAVPILVVNNLCVEMNPTGREIINAMRQLMEEIGIDPNVQLTGSTEDNNPTSQTAAGIVVIGIAHRDTLRVGTSCKGDVLVCIGNPKDGIIKKYIDTDSDVVGIRDIKDICKIKVIDEIVPVGSHGVMYEANEMANTSGLKAEFFENKEIDIESSAGTCTAFVASVKECNLKTLCENTHIPVYIIGRLK